MRGGCRCAGVPLRRVPRHSKIAHLPTVTSTFLAGHLPLERPLTLAELELADFVNVFLFNPVICGNEAAAGHGLVQADAALAATPLP